MSSVDLSVLTFALSSWLDGSAQLRRSLIFLPLGIGGHREQGVPPASPRRAQSTGIGSGRANGGPSRGRLADWCAWWLQKPDRDLDETEKSLMGMFDVSVSKQFRVSFSAIQTSYSYGLSLLSYSFAFSAQVQFYPLY